MLQGRFHASAWRPDSLHAPARLCPNATGADIRSVCTEAGMFAIRARRKTVTEKDFLDAVNKVPSVLCPAVKQKESLQCA